jgi:predicted nucleic acid-binding protein
MQGEFLDANVLVYAFTTDPRAAAQAQLGSGCVTSERLASQLGTLS